MTAGAVDGLRLSTEVRSGVRIVHLEGCTCDGLADPPTAVLGADGRPVVFDLDSLTMVGRRTKEVLEAVVALAGSAPVSLCVGRDTARLFLKRFGVLPGVAVFRTVAEAVRAAVDDARNAATGPVDDPAAASEVA